jgi:hypothetical protein
MLRLRCDTRTIVGLSQPLRILSTTGATPTTAATTRRRRPNNNYNSKRRQQYFSTSSSHTNTEFYNVTTTETIDNRRFYRYLGLETFQTNEIQKTFQRINNNNYYNNYNNSNEDEDDVFHSDTQSTFQDAGISQSQMQVFLENRIKDLEEETIGPPSQYSQEETSNMRRQFSQAEAKRCWNLLKPNGAEILTEKEFVDIVEDTAESLDRRRVFPLTLSMLLVGSSVGVVTPAMPFVVQNIGLTAGEYGLVVSAFALAKMTGNIPSAVLVERHGRKVSNDFS